MAQQQPTMRPIYRLIMNVGTFRDYSPYTAPGCIDMVWFRSYHKYPKKIGGYQSIQYLKSVIDSTGGYGVPRKLLNIINDNKNSVITAGDAYKDAGSSTYPVSGVAIANSTSVSSLSDFINVFLPDSLPAVPELNNNMVWTVATSSSTDHSFNDIIYDGVGTYVGVDLDTMDLFWATDPIGTWTRVTSLETQTYSSLVVKYFQEKWVLLATYSTTPPGMGATKTYRIYTSSDGITWTPQEVLTPYCWPTLDLFTGAAIYASNKFLVIGGNGAAYSDDGANYTQVSLSGVYTWRQMAVDSTNTIVCAVGISGSDMVSAVTTNAGLSWTIYIIRSDASDPYVSICYANGYFVTLTGSGQCARSVDGTSWSTTTSPIVPGGSSAVGFASDGTTALCTFVGTNQFATTVDGGVTWVPASVSSGSYVVSFSGITNYVDDAFFALGAPNGDAWSLFKMTTPINAGNFKYYPLPISSAISGVNITPIAYANGRYAIAVSNTTAIYYSPDLTTWTRATSVSAVLNWATFIGANNRFLLIATNQASSGSFSMSFDANTWNQLPASSKDGTIQNSLMSISSGVYQLYVESGIVRKILETATIASSAYHLDFSSSLVVLGGGNSYKGLTYSTNLTNQIVASNITTGQAILVKYNGDNTFYAAFSESDRPTSTGVLYFSTDGVNWSACLDENDLVAEIGTVSTITKIGLNYVIGTSLGLFYSGDGKTIRKVTYGTGTITSPVLTSYSVGESGMVGTERTVDLKMTIYNSADGIIWTDAADSTVINVNNYPMLFVGHFNGYWVVGIGRNSPGTLGTVMSSPDTIVQAQQALPAVSDIFTPGEYVWNLDAVTLTSGQDTVAASTYIVAQPSCGSFKSIADDTEYYVFIRNLGSMQNNEQVALRFTTPTIPATALKNWMVPMIDGQNINPQATLVEAANVMNSTVKVSGGICAVGPFMFAYGNNGLIRNSDVNNPSSWFSLTNQASVYRNSGLANDVNVGTSKIVKGLPYRGIGTKYAALFWSLDSLIMATFVGAPSVFDYTIISSSVTIIAAHSAIEVYGLYYWIGDNRFYVYAGGQIQEVPNEVNRNWFFNSINPVRQHIIWASINPQYNEIWWFFPKDDSYECNHALIYNYIDRTWYDTPITRGAGFYAGVYNHPVWASNVVTETPYQGYDYNLHEVGVNAVGYTGVISAIYSSITTADIGVTSSAAVASIKNPSGALQNLTQIIRIEPDGQSSGAWSVDVIGTIWARQTLSNTTTYADAITPDVEHFDLREQWRMMYLKFYNNEIDGDWYMGNTLISANIGDCEGM